MESLVAVARALDVPVVELLDATGAWSELEIYGTVGEGGRITPEIKGERVTAPAALATLIPLKVDGAHLYPRYAHGEIIFCSALDRKPADCIGLECMVTVDPGLSVLRTIHPGSKPNRYTLLSHNGPPIVDAVILTARPVISIQRHK